MSGVALINCGRGNFTSVRNALLRIGVEPTEARTPADLGEARAVILPGVGAFPTFMKRLDESGLSEAIRRIVRRGTPLLGICVGMQVLADAGSEHAETPGLGLIPGRVDRITPEQGFRVPHMGWNAVTPSGAAAELFEPGRENSFYFVHSFAMTPDDPADTAATADHGGPIAAAVRRENVVGVQFHPEKSQRDGLGLLRRFVAMAA